MEKDVHVETYLTLSKKGLEATKEEVGKRAIEEFGKKEGADDLYYPELIWEADEIYFENGELFLNGEFFHKGEKLGYLSPTIPLSNDTIIEIINHYMEKMEKVKAVLEATK